MDRQHLFLSKLWYVSQVIRLKTAIGSFVLAGHLYRVDQRQLWLARKKGGLSLVSIEHKMKALFLKKIMLKKVDGVITPHPDHLFEMRQQSTGLTRNIKEWAELSESLDTTTLTSTKQLYNEMLQRENFTPRIEGVVAGLEKSLFQSPSNSMDVGFISGYQQRGSLRHETCPTSDLG
jgi:hypothetical protein